MNIFSRLFSKSGSQQPSQPVQNSIVRPAGRAEDRGRREPPGDVDLNAIEYIPLPVAPRTWEVDGRNEFNSEYQDPRLREVIQAGWEGKYTKVIKLSAGLAGEDFAGAAGAAVAKAYRDAVRKRVKASQFEPAARMAKEMLDRIPTLVTDTDRRQYNKALVELDKAGIRHSYRPVEVAATASEPLFEVSDGSGWTLQDTRVLSKAERPDPAFHLTTFTRDGALYVDTNGKSGVAAGMPGAVRKLDRVGTLVAERSIPHDNYRMGCSPTGSSVAIMDADGKLHVYDGAAATTLERDLRDDRRIKEHFRTTDTEYWGEFKSQVRAVDVSADGECHLFTLADEAWCCSKTGETVWGVRMPLNEGWERVVGRTGRTGPGAEVEAALKTLGLSLPVTPQDVKKQFRKLAMKHHPDRNPGDSSAHKRMQGINDAFQVLTGIDPSTIDFTVEDSDVTYFRRTRPDQVIEVGPIRLEITISGRPAQDWVYGASFAATGAGAFLATYSGKVIEVDGRGTPVRVYDVGTIPSEMVDAGDYLYLLAATRLYVLEQRNRLAAFIDVYRQGKLLVTTAGFGLLDDKRFQWFSPSGSKVGEIRSRDPIRAVYESPSGVVVETRQHRTVVRGLAVFTAVA